MVKPSEYGFMALTLMSNIALGQPPCEDQGCRLKLVLFAVNS